MNVLIACEFSGIVRTAFRQAGHEAWSCDLEPAEDGGPHLCGDVRQWLLPEWDLMIAHPPCTYLAVSGARWWKNRQCEQQEAIEFFLCLARAPVNRIALENPVGRLSTAVCRPHQIIQPWQFGHGETKATCLWLKNLPLLQATGIVSGREARCHRMPPSADRGRERSRTYEGIAQAMAQQWGRL